MARSARAPRLSAVVCSYNRIDYTRRALASLEAQTLPPGALEIVVVDNGSNDGSVAFIEAEARRLPNLVFVTEPTLGLSHARNAGIRAAGGRWVGFIDDDAVAAPDWAETILRVAAEEDAAGIGEVGAIGGLIAPLWEAERPEWFHDDVYGYFSILDRGPVRHTMRGPHEIAYGTNMAFRADVLEACGGFDTALGRKGTSLLSNEETLLQIAIDALGFRRVYDPDVRVEHPVHAVRLSQQWLLKRAYWQGASDAVMHETLAPRGPIVRVGVALLKTGRIPTLAPVLRAARPGAGEPARMLARVHAARRLGYAAALVGLAR